MNIFAPVGSGSGVSIMWNRKVLGWKDSERELFPYHAYSGVLKIPSDG